VRDDRRGQVVSEREGETARAGATAAGPRCWAAGASASAGDRAGRAAGPSWREKREVGPVQFFILFSFTKL
jgi:hypothetical protein